jgi:hypothetical protein
LIIPGNSVVFVQHTAREIIRRSRRAGQQI